MIYKNGKPVAKTVVVAKTAVDCGNEIDCRKCRYGSSCNVANAHQYHVLSCQCYESGPEQCRCGGRLSEVRYHDGKPYRHCFACHFEFYSEE